MKNNGECFRKNGNVISSSNGLQTPESLNKLTKLVYFIPSIGHKYKITVHRQNSEDRGGNENDPKISDEPKRKGETELIEIN